MGLLIPLALILGAVYLVVTTIYNLFFHPLANLPGPFLSRISSFPSFYHACKGDRHIWIWQQFEIYGRKFRVTPNAVLFRSSEAYGDIYNYRANVKKSNFYDAWVRNENDRNTLSCTDVALHAKKRRLLNLAFTDQSVKAAGPFMATHIDRWNELLPGDEFDAEGWSVSRNMTDWTDYLVFDVLGDLCFGKSFETKEPGENKLRDIPHQIVKYMKFMYPITRSPLLDFIVYLKPRGLNDLLEAITPKDIKDYYSFVEASVMRRVGQEKARVEAKAPPDREDMFHFLCTARDPENDQLAFSPGDLLAEANLLIIAGSDTTAITMCGLFFYITHNPRVYDKLVKEIRETFSSPEEIVHGQKLSSCKYLRAVIDETMRMTPSGPSELPRVVLKGGATIDGDFYPEGVIVGTSGWASGRNEEVFGDSYTFRPERWIVSDHPDFLNTQKDVLALRRKFHPFSKGPGNCVGQNIAILQLTMAIARTLWRMDMRLTPGETIGEGSPELGWGRRRRDHFMLQDAYISLREGPKVQLRKRVF